MTLGRLFKDPDATLDYTVDWSDWLTDGEIISSAAWTITPIGPVDGDDDLVIDSDDFDDTTHTAWLSGGQLGRRYTITSRITTDAAIPRIDDRSFDLVIKDQ